MNNFNIMPFSKIGDNVITNFKGYFNSDILISGNSKTPNFNGEIRTKEVEFLIPYLNVNYKLNNNPKFILTDQTFELNNFNLYNSNTNSIGLLYGKINHNKFKNWFLDLNIDTDNLLILNTNYQDDVVYYGKGFLDGNAKRVLVRYFKIEDSIDLTKTVTELWKIAENNLPNKDCDIYTQAIMDVGSLICKRRNPDCHLCPLRKKCIAFKDSIQNNLPNKSPKKAKPIKKLYWLILRNRNGELLLENRNSKGVWEGLWTFIGFKESHSRKEYLEKLPKDFKVLEEGIKTQHVFTHYKLDIDTISIELNKDFKNLDNNKAWFNSEELTNIGLPAPVSKFLNIKK